VTRKQLLVHSIFSRTPTPLPPFAGMNSIPASSRARLIAFRLAGVASRID
jgi:hypothetical protein